MTYQNAVCQGNPKEPKKEKARTSKKKKKKNETLVNVSLK